MKVYIQCSKIHHMPSSDNFYEAQLAFHEKGFDTIRFENKEELGRAEREDIVVGYVGTVTWRLLQLGIEIPQLDYPDCLQDFMRRKVWKSTINTVNFKPELWPVFVKSVANKDVTGKVIRGPKDLVGCGSCCRDKDVYCSEVVNIFTEWRCFVRYGKIVDIRPYKGDYFNYQYDFHVINACVAAYKDAPAGYAIDFGVTDKGQTILVEVNDGYALGGYGLLYYDYAKLLSARWAELTGTEDMCRF